MRQASHFGHLESIGVPGSQGQILAGSRAHERGHLRPQTQQKFDHRQLEVVSDSLAWGSCHGNCSCGSCIAPDEAGQLGLDFDQEIVDEFYVTLPCLVYGRRRGRGR